MSQEYHCSYRWTVAYTNYMGFANPPWCLIGRVMSQACCQQAQLVLVHSTSVEGSNLVSSATRDVVGLLQHDSPNSRSNSETNRCPNGDGPSNSRVACLRKDSLVVPF